jgi:hypothetical protein
MADVTGIYAVDRAIWNELLGALYGKVNLPLNRLPRDLQAVVNKYIPIWSSMTASERATKIGEIDKHHWIKSRIKLRRAEKASQIAQDSPEYELWLKAYRRISAKEREIQTWETLPEPTPTEKTTKDNRLKELGAELAALNAILDATTTDTAAPAPVAVVALGDEAWETQARKRAAAIIKRQRERDLYPSQIHIADEIADEFRTAGVVGVDGKPLSGATIKRHALNGISSAQGKQLSTRTGRGK